MAIWIILAGALGTCMLAMLPPDTHRARRFEPLRTLTRLNPHLDTHDPRQLPVKVRAILRDEYKFFRGTADLFYAWCGDECRDWLADGDARVWLHGDVHVGNVGTYQSRGSLGEDLRFGLVDLDESFEGPFQLDLLRGAVSARFLAAANGVRLSDDQWRDGVAALCAAYRRAWLAGAPKGPAPPESRIARALLSEVRGRASKTYVEKFCDLGERPRFRPARRKGDQVADLMEPASAAEREEVVAALWACIRDELSPGDRRQVRMADESALRRAVLDVARWTRLDSGGSQGVYKYLILVDRPFDDADGPMLIQLKQEPPPAALRAGLIGSAAGAPQDGLSRARRVALAHDRLLPWPKRLVGAAEIGGRGYLVMTKDPWGEEPSGAAFTCAASIRDALELMGEVLGAAHRYSLGDERDAAPRVQAVAARLEGLSEVLARRGEAAERHLRAYYDGLRADPDVQRHIRTADEFVTRFDIRSGG